MWGSRTISKNMFIPGFPSLDGGALNLPKPPKKITVFGLSGFGDFSNTGAPSVSRMSCQGPRVRQKGDAQRPRGWSLVPPGPWS